MNYWYYQQSPVTSIEQLPEGATGFIYKITNTKTGKFYIGKKVLFFTRRKKISQRVKKATKTRKTFEQVTKESDWMDYYGSSKELLADIQQCGKDVFEREILEFCCNKKYLSFAELQWQIVLQVLKKDSYNGNILGRFYSRDMENCKNV